MILSDSFIGLCTLILSILFYHDLADIWHIYLLLALRSIGSAFHAPAMQASIPLLAPENQLARVAGINQVIHSICNIAGPALAALLIGLMDISYILLFDVLGAVIACNSLLFVTIPNPERKEETKLHIIKDLKEAWRGVKEIKGLVSLIIFCIIATFFVMPIGALFPLMTLNHFGGNAFQMSIVEIAWGGMLIAGGVVGIFSLKMNKVLLINSMYLLLGLTFFLSGLLPTTAFWSFVALTLFGGMASSFFYSSFVAVIQLNVDPSILGRVFSVFASVNLLPAMLGLLGTGYVADSIGLDASFVLAGLVIALVGIVSYFFPTMIKLGRYKV